MITNEFRLQVALQVLTNMVRVALKKGNIDVVVTQGSDRVQEVVLDVCKIPEDVMNDVNRWVYGCGGWVREHSWYGFTTLTFGF